MSYILDALRKSDQQRRRGAAPTLLPAAPEVAAPKRQALFAYAALAIVLLGAGIGIGWLRPWQAQRAAPAPAQVAVPAPAPSPVAATAAGVAPGPLPDAQSQHAAPAATAPGAAAAVAAPARQEVVVKGEARGTAPNAVAADAGKAAPEVQAGPAGGVAAQASSAIALRDLPIAIQQELPPMSISVHAWSAIAAQRLVGINNRLLHEGDEVAPGLRLEQITPNGMILNYKGYKFSRGVH